MRAESGDPSSGEGPVHPGLLLQEIDVGPVPPAVPPSNGERFIVDMGVSRFVPSWKLGFWADYSCALPNSMLDPNVRAH
jgi:hypothetical protein